MDKLIQGITTDNSIKEISDIFAGNGIDNYTTELYEISGRTIEQLSNENSLLIYCGGHNKKDEVEKNYIFTIKNNDELETKNIAGFIGTKNICLTIKSRFAKDNDDYFLHYMLQKVFNINISHLEHSVDNNEALPFLPYLFKYFFEKALNQGLYKKYEWNYYNDSRIKGSIDIARHIKYNFMNNGKVAYNMREHSYDNNITQLIRHTIEHIKDKPMYSFILEDADIKPFINTIINETPKYSKNNRQLIINKNLKSHIHPYYSEYEPLRIVCLQILMEDELLKYGSKESKIYGLLFDVAWLWEEYLAIIIRNKYNGDILHPENKTNSGKIKMLEDTWDIYPDFYSKEYNLVMDAKYKHMVEISKIDRNDRNQIIAYMCILGVDNGIFIHPTAEKECEKEEKQVNKEYNNLLTDKKVIKYSFSIPQNIGNMEKFKNEIKKSEDSFFNFIEAVKIIIQSKKNSKEKCRKINKKTT